MRRSGSAVVASSLEGRPNSYQASYRRRDGYMLSGGDAAEINGPSRSSRRDAGIRTTLSRDLAVQECSRKQRIRNSREILLEKMALYFYASKLLCGQFDSPPHTLSPSPKPTPHNRQPNPIGRRLYQKEWPTEEFSSDTQESQQMLPCGLTSGTCPCRTGTSISPSTEIEDQADHADTAGHSSEGICHHIRKSSHPPERRIHMLEGCLYQKLTTTFPTEDCPRYSHPGLLPSTGSQEDPWATYQEPSDHPLGKRSCQTMTLSTTSAPRSTMEDHVVLPATDVSTGRSETPIQPPLCHSETIFTSRITGGGLRQVCSCCPTVLQRSEDVGRGDYEILVDVCPSSIRLVHPMSCDQWEGRKVGDASIAELRDLKVGAVYTWRTGSICSTARASPPLPSLQHTRWCQRSRLVLHCRPILMGTCCKIDELPTPQGYTVETVTSRSFAICERRPQVQSVHLVLQDVRCCDEDDVMSGTLDSLVKLLVPTEDHCPGRAYLFAFLLSSRLFLHPHQLLGEVDKACEAQRDKPHITKLVHHVIRLLSEWTEMFPYDFRDELVMTHVRGISERCIPTDRSGGGREMSLLLRRLLRRLDTLECYEESLRRVPSYGSAFGETDVTAVCPCPMLLAQQLTHVELERMSYIGPEEFVQAYARDTAPHGLKVTKNTFNLEYYLEWSSHLRNLVTSEVYKQEASTRRVQMTEFWLNVATECFNIGNFNSLMAIILGLDATTMSTSKLRLRQIHVSKLRALEQQMHPSCNFSNYRSILKAASVRSERRGISPEKTRVVIPYFSLLLRDIYLVSEECASRLANGHINLEKFWELAKLVTQFLTWRQVDYPFERNSQVMSYLQTCPTPTENEKVVCYFESWAVYRTGDGAFNIEDIDASLCTHLLYSFVNLGDDDGYNKVNNLKNQGTGIKIMAALGGGSAGSATFSTVVNDASKRSAFVDNAVNFLSNYGFDGMDIDWEYPASGDGSRSSDKEAFVETLKELRSKFDKHGYLLSVAVGAGNSFIGSSYDVTGISQSVDFINVMTYDFHSGWESYTGENAPLYARSSDSYDESVDSCIQGWLSAGAPAEKIIMGMGLFGISYNLVNADDRWIGSPANGPGAAGIYTEGEGSLGYMEICQYQQDGADHWHIEWDDESKVPYGSDGTLWVGYDSPDSLWIKAQYVSDKGLGGAMVWSIDMDDARGTCGTKYHLLKNINTVLRS
uniref:Ras-GEF domain-containing protein n=1 Tax=Timema shepardi TaxID=629360 RepID=A0A7R9B284_TIMSH|nr:unnamed protein product [Timema shepardi]